MILFENFLCCVPLKIFGNLIGWIGATVSIALAYITLLLVLVLSPEKMHGYKTRLAILEGVSENDLPEHLIIIACIAFFVAVFHVSLIFGIKFRKAFAIVPYLLLLIAGISFLSCILPYEKTLEMIPNKTAVISIYLVALLFSIYLILCIHSLYKIVKFEEKRRKNYILPN